jgi:hypothetical protein
VFFEKTMNEENMPGSILEKAGWHRSRKAQQGISR